MIAAELYKRTLSGYQASLKRGDDISLSAYCKIHQVNNRGLRYWMKKNSIRHPKSLPPVGSTFTCCVNGSNKSVIPSTGLIPFAVQHSSDSQAPVPTTMKSFLKDIDFTTVSGIVINIKEISCADLATLILSCNIR